MITDTFFHTISTKRLVQGPGIQKTYQTNLTNQPCLIQPITPEFAQKTGMVFDRTYNCMVDVGIDIQVADKVTDQDGKNYTVAGSLNRNYGYNTSHVTYLLSEESKATPDI